MPTVFCPIKIILYIKVEHYVLYIEIVKIVTHEPVIAFVDQSWLQVGIPNLKIVAPQPPPLIAAQAAEHTYTDNRWMSVSVIIY